MEIINNFPFTIIGNNVNGHYKKLFVLDLVLKMNNAKRKGKKTNLRLPLVDSSSSCGSMNFNCERL